MWESVNRNWLTNTHETRENVLIESGLVGELNGSDDLHANRGDGNRVAIKLESDCFKFNRPPFGQLAGDKATLRRI